MKKLLIASCAAMLLAPTAAFADHDAEMIIAYGRADDAFNAKDINQVHLHLHEVVNCLVGPKGKGFDAKFPNPCAKLGPGAINDAPDSAMQYNMLVILANLNAGLATKDLAKAKRHAGDASVTFSAGEC